MDLEKEVRRIAALSRIELKEEDLPRVQENFQRVLSYFEKLQEVNTENVEEFSHFEEGMTLRTDEVEPSVSREALLQNAPDSFESCYRIPRVVGEAE